MLCTTCQPVITSHVFSDDEKACNVNDMTHMSDIALKQGWPFSAGYDIGMALWNTTLMRHVMNHLCMPGESAFLSTGCHYPSESVGTARGKTTAHVCLTMMWNPVRSHCLNLSIESMEPVGCRGL